MGNIAHCTYELQNVDHQRNTATVSFSGTATTTLSYDQPIGKGRHKETIIEKQFGKWILNLQSGFPESFHATRSTKHIYDKQTEIEDTITDAKLGN